jgi:DNA-binding HxlR family transcriptional regulator
MADGSFEESRDELLELKKVRKVSPATNLQFEMMIESYGELERLPRGSEPHRRKQRLILKQEMILEGRLAKDAKYKDLLVEFRRLLSQRLLIRYGDYFKGNVFVIKSKCSELAKQKKIERDILAQMTWNEVLLELAIEARQMKDYEAETASIWQNNDLGVPQTTPAPSKPLSPVTELIQTLAEMCNMDFNHVCWEIEEYVKRNQLAHPSGIDTLIANGNWNDVAELIVRDTKAIQEGLLVPEMEHLKNEMLETLNIFQSRYFANIKTSIHPVTGLVKIDLVTLSAEELQRQAAANAAKLVNDIQQLKKTECDEILERVKIATHYGYSLKKAQADVLKALMEMQDTSQKCKQAQTDSGKAMKNYKEALLRYKKPEKGTDED